jgi:hypothetical protein
MNYKKEMIIRYNKESNTINSVLKNKDLMEIINHKKQIILTKIKESREIYTCVLKGLGDMLHFIEGERQIYNSYVALHYGTISRYLKSDLDFKNSTLFKPMILYTYLLNKFKRTKDFLISSILYNWKENRISDILHGENITKKVDYIYKKLDLDKIIKYYTIKDKNYYKLQKVNSHFSVLQFMSWNNLKYGYPERHINFHDKKEISLNNRRDKTKQGLVDKLGNYVKVRLYNYIYALETVNGGCMFSREDGSKTTNVFDIFTVWIR